MPLDLDRAWRETMRLLKGNRPLLIGVAGVFFFLPYLGFLLALPHLATLPTPDADFAMVLKQMEAVYAEVWWIVALAFLSVIYGTLAMLALVRLRARPTVGEALKLALAALPTYVLAFLLASVTIQLVVAVLTLSVAATGLAALAAATMLGAVALQLYWTVRISMTAPVMVVEGERNPLRALRRSWTMTRGNAGRMLGFFALVVAALFVVSLLVAIVGGLVIALLGESAAGFADAILSAALMSAAFTLFACVLAAIYAQLSRGCERPSP